MASRNRKAASARAPAIAAAGADFDPHVHQAVATEPSTEAFLTVTADVADLFNLLTGFGRPHAFRKLLVAPFGLREGLIERIREVRSAAARGKHARIRIKVNNLSDEEVIQELYRASQEGASVEIVARSICTLRPGLPGLSEGIRVRSILGRFLEHSRVFIFEAGEQRTVLMGSADLMPRNLDHRIELVAPVEDGRAQLELGRAFDAMLSDTYFCNFSVYQSLPDS